MKSFSRCVNALCLTSAFGTAAAADDTTPGAGDAASYFLQQAVESENPWGTPKGPPGGESPLVIWKGPNESFLRATFKAEMAYFDQDNSWFGQSQENLGAKSTDWWETEPT